MISENDKRIILAYAEKYELEKVVLFGSAQEKEDARDIDIAIKGITEKFFFRFCWELYRDLSKPVDVIDLNKKSMFNTLVEKDGIVLYG